MIDFYCRIAIFFFGVLIIAVVGPFSADFENYGELISGPGSPDTFVLLEFILQSKIFYYLGQILTSQFGTVSLYIGVWGFAFVMMSIAGFKSIHWLVFFAFFPGFDFLTNVIRHLLAISFFFGFSSINSLLSLFFAIFIHPSIVASFLFYKLLLLKNNFFLILGGLALGIGLVILFLAFRALYDGFATKLLVKLGAGNFGLLFTLLIYLTLFFLLAAVMWLLPNPKSLIYAVAILFVFFSCVLDLYFYRLLYIFYPFLAKDLGDAVIDRWKSFGPSVTNKMIVLGLSLSVIASLFVAVKNISLFY